jgi:hypothetical protein
MNSHPQDYQSYLLRLWRVSEGGYWTWRASLQDVATAQRHSFASLEAMFGWVESQISAPTPPEEETSGL